VETTSEAVRHDSRVRLPLDKLVRLHVRRGIASVLSATVADQDREHRRPREFTEAGRANLASALDRGDVYLSGSGPEALTADDINRRANWPRRAGNSRAGPSSSRSAEDPVGGEAVTPLRSLAGFEPDVACGQAVVHRRCLRQLCHGGLEGGGVADGDQPGR
jgi:hypothetical protein